MSKSKVFFSCSDCDNEAAVDPGVHWNPLTLEDTGLDLYTTYRYRFTIYNDAAHF